LILIHGRARKQSSATAERLIADADAREGLAGWGDPMAAEQLSPDPKNRTVHFGFRDNMAVPRVVGHDFDRFTRLRHRAGELVLGYENDEGFNRWDDGLTNSDVADFFRNGSFAVLRKIKQDEESLQQVPQGAGSPARLPEGEALRALAERALVLPTDGPDTKRSAPEGESRSTSRRTRTASAVPSVRISDA
jgi:hypothetical protein